MRSGIGYDVHRFKRGRKLILAGVTIPEKRGLFGHSDADVLTHAIIDAILGASGLGDIGRHFPNTDPSFSGADSMELLTIAYNKVKEKGFLLHNLDAIVIAEKPKLVKYIPEMEENLAKTLDSKIGAINVKATTTEGLGFEGKGKGIGSWAIVTLEETHPKDDSGKVDR